ncbi:unnamed protein product, partial [Thlaspi arvense]
MQQLNLGSSLQPLQLSIDTRRRNARDNRLNSIHHIKILWMRNTLPKAWRLHDRVHGQINEDGTIQFYFQEEHQLLSVIERGPLSFKYWMIVIDRWTRRLYPDYLQSISFSVQIFGIPNEYHNRRVVEDICRHMGQIEGVRIVEPTRDNPSEHLIFTRYIQFEECDDPVQIRFFYERLKKFCRRCGMLTHDESQCPPTPPPNQQALLAPILQEDPIPVDEQLNEENIPSQNLEQLNNEHDFHTTSDLAVLEAEDEERRKDDIYPDDYFTYITPPLLYQSSKYAHHLDLTQSNIIVEAGSYSHQVKGSKRSHVLCLTYIYGNPDTTSRHSLWNKMISDAAAGFYSSRPWLVLEKLGGPKRLESTFSTFRRMLNSTSLHDLRTLGGKYTWIGQRYKHKVKSKIDRALASADWLDAFPRAYVQLLDWIGSDHRLLLVHTGENKWKGHKLFRYDNRWRFNKENRDKLRSMWLFFLDQSLMKT